MVLAHLFDQESSDLSLLTVLNDSCPDHEQIGYWSIGDPRLAAVQHPSIRGFRRGRLHRGWVRSMIWLGQTLHVGQLRSHGFWLDIRNTR